MSLCLSTHSVYGFRATLYPSLSRLSVSRSAERLASASRRGLDSPNKPARSRGGVTIAEDRNAVKTAFNRDQNATKAALTETKICLNQQKTPPLLQHYLMTVGLCDVEDCITNNQLTTSQWLNTWELKKPFG